MVVQNFFRDSPADNPSRAQGSLALFILKQQNASYQTLIQGHFSLNRLLTFSFAELLLRLYQLKDLSFNRDIF